MKAAVFVLLAGVGHEPFATALKNFAPRPETFRGQSPNGVDAIGTIDEINEPFAARA
jgi:hypothetical protein